MARRPPPTPESRRGRPRAELVLTAEERAVLERFTNRRKTAQALALRARIVLACAEKAQPSNQVVAERLHVNQATVGKWRRRFVAERLDGLLDDPRPGAPSKISDDKGEGVLVKTLEETPVDATHWSTRSMARRPSSVSSRPSLECRHTECERRTMHSVG